MRVISKILLFFISFFSLELLFAHGEEITIGQTAKEPIQLTPTQTKLLGVQVEQVRLRPLTAVLTLNGQVQLIPDAQADVSTRISGSITEIFANLGDNVEKGQKLAIVQSRLVGNPPPSVAVNAPIAGLIDARNVNVGQAVEPNTVLFHISNRKTLLVLAQVYEEDLSKIKVKQAVNIHPLSYPKEIFPGELTLIQPNLDPLTRTVNVQVTFANRKQLLKPGMFVTADVILNENKAAMTISTKAILEYNGESFVFTRDNNLYRRKLITLGASNDHLTEIQSGLQLNEYVVTQGAHQLFTLWLSGKSKIEGEQ